ncbi:MAG: MBL fold metallo-hydrolase [Bacillota bacterium]|nr:MBL fold metallo-hydrolase [Bacillota bacterium]
MNFPDGGMAVRVQWHGHACFRLTTAAGLVIVTDPFDESVGYLLPRGAADVVTVSHEHFDHNHVAAVGGRPLVLKGAGVHSLAPLGPEKSKGATIRGVASFHDSQQGRQRGPNTIFVFDLDGLRVVHLGDLGHQLTAQQVAELGEADLLLVPVGGTYTLDGAGAAKVVEALRPALVIPMHYRTDALSFPLAPVDDFLRAVRGRVERSTHTTVELEPQDLGRGLEPRILVLQYQ